MRLIPQDINLPFMDYRRYFVIGSIVTVAAAIAIIVVSGGPKAGIDFSGGTELQIQGNQALNISDIREEITKIEGVGDFEVQKMTSGGEEEYLIRLQNSSDDLAAGMGQLVVSAVNARYGENASTLRREESVGPKIGKELRQKALWAVILAVIGMMIYIWYAFRSLSYGIGALAALTHDVLITIGIFILLGKEFNLPIIAALLTIVGYSVNDTIIVSDRIRENVRKEGDRHFIATANKSINQTLSRTVLTAATTLAATLLLLILGGSVIHDFALALTIGIVVGTYSSIYVASPYVIMWNSWMKNRAAMARSAGHTNAPYKSQPAKSAPRPNVPVPSETHGKAVDSVQTGKVGPSGNKGKKKKGSGKKKSGRR